MKANTIIARVAFLAAMATLVLFLWPGNTACQPVTPPLTVVIDPGHGGRDAGASGLSGVVEKELTLALARELAAVLEKQGTARPVLTRQDDYALSLDDRAGIANHRNGDLFISLHLGNGFNRNAQGFTIYAWSPAARPLDAAGARDATAWDWGQLPYWEQSRKLSKLVRQQMAGVLHWPGQATAQVDLYLLARVRMPAILIELGSVSNPAEAAQLKQPDFQRKLVQAIAAAIAEYRALLHAKP
ncbi:MAG: N-acetylmuramoyl-L-alanine amidase [Deltaproteobacteria bacterium]|nr:N-acetylmuramoyl-L-alanine amidase [Deltaproteobacteria bacterium]